MSAQFEVGQQVAGDDYTRLPVGSKVQFAKCDPLTKVAEDAWRGQGDGAYPDAEMASCVMPRTLTRLGDGLADWERELLAEVDAEDKDDLYVEPEPLKEGDWCLVWAEVQGSEWSDDTTPVHLPVPDPDLIFVPRDAIVRPDAGQVPPWVKAVEEPAGLGAVVVVNTNGRKWVRSRPGYADPWQQVGGDGQRRWSDFPADVEVLSEGWTDGAS